jgi:MAP3K TRAFs-binding domain
VPQTPLCFVAMPLGVKPDEGDGRVDFDAVFADLLDPAIRAAGLEPSRMVWEPAADAPHQHFCLAEFAIADLTLADAGLLFALGIREAVRPGSTIRVGATAAALDLATSVMLRYQLDADGCPARPAEDRAAMVEALEAARRAAAGPPTVPLFGDVPRPPLDRMKTDVFRERTVYSTAAKRRLANARSGGAEAVRAEEQKLGSLEDADVAVLIDLLLSYRATRAWHDMARLVEAMPAVVRRLVLVREQLALALNRSGRSEEAERELLAVIADHGPSSETYGLLGRVYKDRWESERAGSVRAARALLEQAIDAYRCGFEADWRDAFPGINAVTLLEIREPGGPEQRALMPAVAYANHRRIAGADPDYWDHATRLELAVVGRDAGEAAAAADAALAAVREPWEPEATAYNLSLIREARATRGERVGWADRIERELGEAGRAGGR